MKNLIKKISFIIAGLLMINIYASAQVKGKKLKELIEKQNYAFIATSATSQGGRNIPLTSEYDLKVSKDTISSYLPFFGRAYTAPFNDTEGGIKFQSKDFSYNKTLKKKNGWSIVITPKDVSSINSLTLEISESGYGTLSITSNQKSFISYYGYITAVKNK